MQGQPFAFEGKHYTARPTDFFLPDPPAQRPHPPVWVVGVYFVDRSASARSSARPAGTGCCRRIAENGERDEAAPSGLAEAVDIVRRLRAEAGLSMDGFDVVVEGDTFGGWVEHRLVRRLGGRRRDLVDRELVERRARPRGSRRGAAAGRRRAARLRRGAAEA